MNPELRVTCQIRDLSLGEANLLLEEGQRWGLPGHLNGSNLVFEVPGDETAATKQVLNLLDGALAGRHACVQLHPAHGPPLFAGAYRTFAEGVRA